MKTNKDLEARVTALEQKVFGKEELYVDKTGKVWSPVAKNEMTWNEAVEYAKDLRAGGYDDWRLPTLDELLKLKDESPTIADYYWSSTESGANAYGVGFDSGDVDAGSKADGVYVRCVRG